MGLALGRQQALDVARDEIYLEVHPTVCGEALEGGAAGGVRDQHGIEDVAIDTVHSEANAIDTDRAFTRNKALNLARHADAQDAVGKTQDLAHPVDMAGDQMAAEIERF